MERMGQASSMRLNNIRQEEGKSLRSYFIQFRAELITYDIIYRYALWNGLLMKTPYWVDLHNLVHD